MKINAIYYAAGCQVKYLKMLNTQRKMIVNFYNELSLNDESKIKI